MSSVMERSHESNDMKNANARQRMTASRPCRECVE
jgi:hypothetical protein